MRTALLAAHLPLAFATAALAAPQTGLRRQVQEAYATMAPSLRKAEALVVEGKVSEANALLLSCFPQASRTPAQALTLANVLFRQDYASSYALHKEAAAALPSEPSVQYEWALELHRAKEYAAAAEVYRAYLKTAPNFAPAQGLLAECLLRTGDVPGAVSAWQASESGSGSIETFESLLCELHTFASPDARREALVAKTAAGDLDAAEQLVALDAAWPANWWNTGPKATHLNFDAGLLARLPESPRRAQLLAAADVASADRDTPDAVKSAFANARLLLDKDATLPESPLVCEVLIARIEAAGLLTPGQIRDRLGAKLERKATETKDPTWFKLATHVYVETDRLEALDKLAWDATGGESFGVALLAHARARGTASLDDPLLKQLNAGFPDNAVLAYLTVELAEKAHADLGPALVRGIKAEFSRLSPSGMFSRPSANTLRLYFAKLANAQPPSTTRP